MKQIKVILKEQNEIIISFIVGVIVMGSIGYGVNQIQSSSVSYTRDGKTMSVEAAIDDLIVKVNKKGGCGVFNITLRDQKMSVSDSITTTWLKGFIDETLNTMFSSIDNLKEVKTEELTKLKNGEYTWSSSNTNIVVIDGTIVTPKKAGTVNVVATTDGGASVTIPLVISENLYLADVVSVGDYVAYDAGTWTETKEKPTSRGQFGGYTAGQNKANSVAGNAKGWRVYSIDTSTKTVTLIHGGHPEYYFHAYNSFYASTSVSNLNNRAASEYLNSDYASSAHMMNKGEADQNILRTTGVYYWLATTYDINTLWSVSNNGGVGDYNPNSVGVRPVVVLKSNILTTGKGTDMVGQSAWTLVKP